MRTPNSRPIALAAATTLVLWGSSATHETPTADAAKPPTRIERQTQETAQYLSARIVSLFKHERGVRYQSRLGQHIVAKGVRFGGVTSLIGPEDTGGYTFNVQSRDGHARDPKQIDIGVNTGSEDLAAITYAKQGRGWIMGANIATKGGNYSFTVATDPSLGFATATRKQELALDEMSNQILNAADNNGRDPRIIGYIQVPPELAGLGSVSSPEPPLPLQLAA